MTSWSRLPNGSSAGAINPGPSLTDHSFKYMCYPPLLKMGMDDGMLPCPVTTQIFSV